MTDPIEPKRPKPTVQSKPVPEPEKITSTPAADLRERVHAGARQESRMERITGWIKDKADHLIGAVLGGGAGASGAIVVAGVEIGTLSELIADPVVFLAAAAGLLAGSLAPDLVYKAFGKEPPEKED